MRPIKFKAWDNIDKRMVVVESITFHHLEGIPQTVKFEGKEWAASRFELLAFTGLRDKNGKEIYEGDIVTLPVFNFNTKSPKTAIVKFYAPCFCLVPVTDDDGKGQILVTPSDIREVIDNIYENPELVKE